MTFLLDTNTDNDFDHLDTIFLNIPKIDLLKLSQY